MLPPAGRRGITQKKSRCLVMKVILLPVKHLKVQSQVTLGFSHTAGIHNHLKVRHEGKKTARPQRTLLVCANLGNISNRRFFVVFVFFFFLDTQSKYLCTTWLHKINYDFSTSQTMMHSLLRQLKDTTVSC